MTREADFSQLYFYLLRNEAMGEPSSEGELIFKSSRLQNLDLRLSSLTELIPEFTY